MDDNAVAVLREIHIELCELNKQVAMLSTQLSTELQPLAAITPLLDKIAPLLDNPAARWAAKRKMKGNPIVS